MKNTQRRRIILHTIRTHYEQYGYEDLTTPRDWEDVRRRAAYLTRCDLETHRFGKVVEAFHELERTRDGDPELVPDQRTDRGPAQSTLIDYREQDLNVAMDALLPFEQDWQTGTVKAA